jgi:hypothetical protein
VLATVLGAESNVFAADKVDFRRDIKPILSDNCFTCHGPDDNQRKAGLRLDIESGAFAALKDGHHALVPGKVAESALYARISSNDPDELMPPSETGKSLTEQQVELFRRWIEQGAEWLTHWSFVPIERPALPVVENATWVRNPIDQYIQSRLEREGLSPADEADKTTLIRRVTLDLTGLPPTPDEVDAFVNDDAPDAYDRLVSRLLDSPRYGEHMARYWLDVARYGDTHGLHLDNFRSIWPYRDWVINAFNDNKPFDTFTVEQLAGDLLPNPSIEQRIATGFNRCNVTTSEGGSIDEEYLVRYAVDRVETTSTVWLGLTLGCAVCHEHKFDPVSQKEFYQLFAYFNSLTERAMDGNKADPPPVIRVPSEEQTTELAQLRERINALQARLDGPMPEVDAAQVTWQDEWSEKLKNQWELLEPVGFLSTGGATLRKLDDQSVLAEGFAPDRDVYEVVTRTDKTGITALRLEALTHESLPDNGPGRATNANYVLSEFEAEAVSVLAQDKTKKVSFLLAHADYAQAKGDFVIEKAIDGKTGGKSGWAVDGDKRHENRTAVFVASEPIGFDGGTILRVRLRHDTEHKQHAIGRFRLATSTDATLVPARLSEWHTVGPFETNDGKVAYNTVYEPEKKVDLAATYNEGKLKWEKKPDFVDGKIHELKGAESAVYLYRTIHAPSPRQMTLSVGSNDAIKVWLNETVVLDKNVQRGVKADQDTFNVDLQAGENRLLMKVVNYGGNFAFYFKMVKDHGGGESLTLSPLLATGERSATQQQALRDYYRRTYSSVWQKINGEKAKLQEQQAKIQSQIPTTLVMQDMDQRRQAYLLVRGEYDKRGDPVEPGVPANLPPALPADSAPNRLSLARWLVDRDHPLTARVTVNRYWQQYFGAGIVKTTEDFGAQGDWPTHPEVLDWLSAEFIESGWDVKHIQRLIVTSATYRQSAAVDAEKLAKDRTNRLLARGSRFRMDAEMVRDNALAVSGLLVERNGGPSVKPYQPGGLWKAVGYTSSNTANFKKDTGDNLYRRSMYTFWKRTSPPPSMLTFDAPSRESCTARRARTNTPLQALVLMNDEQYVETARHLAVRMMTECGSDAAGCVTYGFQLATARRPNDDESNVLLEVYRAHRDRYQADPEAAAKLLDVGDHKTTNFDVSELAAWTMVANLILNLDETVTKG